jgi:hypothetical protein
MKRGEFAWGVALKNALPFFMSFFAMRNSVHFAIWLAGDGLKMLQVKDT